MAPALGVLDGALLLDDARASGIRRADERKIGQVGRKRPSSRNYAIPAMISNRS